MFYKKKSHINQITRDINSHIDKLKKRVKNIEERRYLVEKYLEFYYSEKLDTDKLIHRKHNIKNGIYDRKIIFLSSTIGATIGFIMSVLVNSISEFKSSSVIEYGGFILFVISICSILLYFVIEFGYKQLQLDYYEQLDITSLELKLLDEKIQENIEQYKKDIINT